MKVERIYQYFVELIFAVTKDVKKLDREAFDIILEEVKAHPWGHQLDFRKDYGRSSERDAEYRFRKLIAACEMHGADREYEFFIQILTKVAALIKTPRRKKEVAAMVVKQLRLTILILNTQESASPGIFNFLLESRAVFEWSSMAIINRFLPKKIDGKGNPVLLLPPLFGGDFSTKFIRKFLNEQGFSAYKWNLGVNLLREYYLPPLENRLEKLFNRHQQKVSIVGWSGGGMLGKVIANRHPDKVAQLVTIGSPVWGLDGLQTPLKGIYELLRGRPLSERNEQFNSEVDAVPKVPITCVYTKTDGVVPWKNCLESESLRDDIQNIEVYGSHSGLGANPAVLLVVAYALSQRLEGKNVGKLPPSFEKILYPYFWQRKKEEYFGKKG